MMVFKPLMPLGVEHDTFTQLRDTSVLIVFKPLMPLGVEHLGRLRDPIPRFGV